VRKKEREKLPHRKNAEHTEQTISADHFSSGIVDDATGTRLKQHARRQRRYLRRQPLPAS
jgi:hypothetical protein